MALRGISRLVRGGLKRIESRLPAQVRGTLRRTLGHAPPVQGINFGDFRSTRPMDPDFGYGRGTPVDRYYIHQFLDGCRSHIAGHVLEVGDRAYTEQFGSAVSRSSVLHVDADNPVATHVADLADAPHLPSNEFDCIILTQTLHLIFDVPAALRTLHRILRPGGVLLATVPGVSQVDRGDWAHTWFWSFTPLSAARMLDAAFGAHVQLTTTGNVLAATAALHGIAAEELTAEELEVTDPSFPVVITVRATKAHADT